MAYPKSVRIGPYDWPWTFFVVARAPCAIVIGLDAIWGWPLFYSPLDDRLFVVEDIGGRCDPKRAISNDLFDDDALLDCLIVIACFPDFAT